MTHADSPCFGLIGHPVEHSLSPQLHQLISQASEQPCRYDLCDIWPADLANALPRAYDGYNVTVPHKQAILPLLESVTEEAGRLGAVNTVYQGRGCNTDIMGLRRALPPCKGQTVLLIGYGGVAEALAAVVLERGCAQLLITGRNRYKAQGFAEKLREKGWGSGQNTAIKALSYDELEQADLRCELLLQATPSGMWPRCGDLPLPDELLRKLFTRTKPYVFDTIYNPAATRLLLMAKSHGLATANGLLMLFWQGLEARKIWQPQADFSKAEAAADRICAELAQTLRKKYPLKLVLSGFMGSGKTTLLQAVRIRLGAAIDTLDLDEAIVKHAGRSIPEIFATEGEAGFRAVEARLLEQILTEKRGEKSLLLATGGGTVVQDGAEARIHAAGAQVIYLKVSLETALERIGPGAPGRPMLAGEAGLGFAWKSIELYNQRKARYEAAADLTLNAELPPAERLQQLLDGLAWL